MLVVVESAATRTIINTSEAITIVGNAKPRSPLSEIIYINFSMSGLIFHSAPWYTKHTKYGGFMANTDNSTARVTVYSTPTCAFCKTEKQYLEHLGVAFNSKDIELEPESMEELQQKLDGNFTGVPVTDINGEIVVGFNRPKIDELLKKHGLVKA